MEKPNITKETTETLLETKFLKVFDLQYAPGKHYFDATRRSKENLVALQSEELCKTMLPDAATCIVVLQEADKEAKLLLTYEFRYPTGQFLLSPPAGLIDPQDKQTEQPLLETAAREIQEETGLTVGEHDSMHVVNPCLFSSPGMTDESNALVCAVLHPEDLSHLTQAGAVGSECFDGFVLLNKAEAQEILRQGRDAHGMFYSVYTWAALLYFVSDLWEQ